MGFAMEDGLISSFPSLGASVSSFPSVPLGVVLYWICPMSWILAYRRWNTNHPRPSWMLGLRWKQNFWDLEKPRKNVENTGNIRTWEVFSEAKKQVWWQNGTGTTLSQVQQREITRDCLISWFSSLVDEYDYSSTNKHGFKRIARTILEYLTICAQHTCRYTILKRSSISNLFGWVLRSKVYPTQAKILHYQNS